MSEVKDEVTAGFQQQVTTAEVPLPGTEAQSWLPSVYSAAPTVNTAALGKSNAQSNSTASSQTAAQYTHPVYDVKNIPMPDPQPVSASSATATNPNATVDSTAVAANHQYQTTGNEMYDYNAYYNQYMAAYYQHYQHMYSQMQDPSAAAAVPPGGKRTASYAFEPESNNNQNYYNYYASADYSNYAKAQRFLPGSEQAEDDKDYIYENPYLMDGYDDSEEEDNGGWALKDYEDEYQAVEDMEYKTRELIRERARGELNNDDTQVVIKQMKRAADFTMREKNSLATELNRDVNDYCRSRRRRSSSAEVERWRLTRHLELTCRWVLRKLKRNVGWSDADINDTMFNTSRRGAGGGSGRESGRHSHHQPNLSREQLSCIKDVKGLLVRVQDPERSSKVKICNISSLFYSIKHRFALDRLEREIVNYGIETMRRATDQDQPANSPEIVRCLQEVNDLLQQMSQSRRSSDSGRSRSHSQSGGHVPSLMDLKVAPPVKYRLFNRDVGEAMTTALSSLVELLKPTDSRGESPDDENDEEPKPSTSATPVGGDDHDDDDGDFTDSDIWCQVNPFSVARGTEKIATFPYFSRSKSEENSDEMPVINTFALGLTYVPPPPEEKEESDNANEDNDDDDDHVEEDELTRNIGWNATDINDMLNMSNVGWNSSDINKTLLKMSQGGDDEDSERRSGRRRRKQSTQSEERSSSAKDRNDSVEDPNQVPSDEATPTEEKGGNDDNVFSDTKDAKAMELENNTQGTFTDSSSHPSNADNKVSSHTENVAKSSVCLVADYADSPVAEAPDVPACTPDVPVQALDVLFQAPDVPVQESTNPKLEAHSAPAAQEVSDANISGQEHDAYNTETIAVINNEDISDTTTATVSAGEPVNQDHSKSETVVVYQQQSANTGTPPSGSITNSNQDPAEADTVISDAAMVESTGPSAENQGVVSEGNNIVQNTVSPKVSKEDSTSVSNQENESANIVASNDILSNQEHTSPSTDAPDASHPSKAASDESVTEDANTETLRKEDANTNGHSVLCPVMEHADGEVFVSTTQENVQTPPAAHVATAVRHPATDDATAAPENVQTPSAAHVATTVKHPATDDATAAPENVQTPPAAHVVATAVRHPATDDATAAPENVQTPPAAHVVARAVRHPATDDATAGPEIFKAPPPAHATTDRHHHASNNESVNILHQIDGGSKDENYALEKILEYTYPVEQDENSSAQGRETSHRDNTATAPEAGVDFAFQNDTALDLSLHKDRI